MSKVSIEDQIKCVRRELALRRIVYKKRVDSGAMTQSTANREIAAMEAVEATLLELFEKQKTPNLF